MTLSLHTDVKNARALAIKTQLGAACKIKFYSGTPPADAEAALGGAVLLATVTLASPAAPDPTTGALAFTMPQEANAVASGTASFFRATTSADVVKIQGTVAEGSGGDINLVESDLVSGLPVRISSLVWTEA
jgi:hypothetical protein